MRANENLMIVDDQVVLVPYREEHVAKYHEWMSDPTLQELTASEPLTLEEEYEMQKKWQQDDDKLTFIICARTNDHPIDDYKVTSPSLTMIGDVNLFLKGESTDPEFEVEVEIMIAESAYRRKGLALTALQVMLSYATCPAPPFVSAATHAPLPVPRERLVVRIGDKNEPSVRLFEKLGFTITKRVEVFEEIEMRYNCGSQKEQWSGWRLVVAEDS
ncbi:acyl-CoA N-acyltransferase [Irpex rosettiformis]|uniref:Acyl-CoA N-acyltransferase n=1 Tax=Irpex rosettiformis TaxID=378272 RepID=A0ACB8U613_9APHY|nr:acyl-CoA N-acyltransferase [Irpex rosettiformis]